MRLQRPWRCPPSCWRAASPLLDTARIKKSGYDHRVRHRRGIEYFGLVSIMARSMGIPAVVGVGPALEKVMAAKKIALDGGEGSVFTDPDQDTVARFEKMSAALAEKRAILEEYRHVEAITSEGRTIKVAANLGSASEAEAALERGAEGVKLFRTEFLFMQRDDLPSEDEQYEAYSAVARAFGEKPVIIRTLDVGGDKDLQSG